MAFKSTDWPGNSRGTNITSGTVSGKVSLAQMNRIARFEGFSISVNVSGTYSKTTSGSYDVYTFTGPGSWEYTSPGFVADLYVDGTGGGGGGGGSPNPGAPFGPAGSGGGGGSGANGLARFTGNQTSATWTITAGSGGSGGNNNGGASQGGTGGTGTPAKIVEGPSTTIIEFGGGAGGEGGKFSPPGNPRSTVGTGGAGGTVTIDPRFTTIQSNAGNTGTNGGGGTCCGGGGASNVWPSYPPSDRVVPVPSPIISATGDGGAGGPSPHTGYAGEPGEFLRIYYDTAVNNFQVTEL